MPTAGGGKREEIGTYSALPVRYDVGYHPPLLQNPFPLCHVTCLFLSSFFLQQEIREGATCEVDGGMEGRGRRRGRRAVKGRRVSRVFIHKSIEGGNR